MSKAPAGADEAELRAAGDGRYVLRGPVVFATAAGLLETSRRLFGNEPQLTVDLSEVTRVDSAALALLLEWLRRARAEGRGLRYEGLPEKLHAIAALSGVQKLLEAGDGAGASAPSGAAQSGSPSSKSSKSSRK